MNSRVVLLAAGAMAISGCATRPVNGRHAGAAPSAAVRRTPPAGGLEFAVDPAAAEIFVDGQRRGTVDDLAATGGILALPPGIYQVSLKAAGRTTWRAEVAVGTARERIEVKLLRRGSGAP